MFRAYIGYSLIKLLIAVLLFVVVAYVVSIALVFVPAALGCVWYAKRKRGFRLRKTWASVRSGQGGLASLAVITITAVLSTLGAVGVLGSVTALKVGGDTLEALLTLAGSMLMIASAIYIYASIVNGVYMKDIFSVIDDMDKFDEFADGASKDVVIDINPEELRAALRADVIGQDSIIDECVSTLARRVRLQRKNKPLGVFMFVGSSGAGKTELAKSLAKHAFENRMVRFDMNQFTEAHSTQSLIGSPAGYIGSDKGGQLTQEIQRLKTGVILFDEIEKAHADVYKLIMTLLDEGRITEQSTGKVMDASKFVIVLTSNAEHEKLASVVALVTDPEDRRRAVKDTLLTVFKPEQLARIDEVFCFGKLDKRSQAKVIGKFLFGYAAEVGVELAKVDADLLIDTIKKHEKQSDYGIRELVRLVEKAVCDGMLEAKDQGFAKVAISLDGEKVVVSGVSAQGAAA